MSQESNTFAKQECIIHSQMEHDNIVELYNYTETEDSYIMFMEFCDKPSYFSDKILDVFKFFNGCIETHTDKQQ